MIVNVLSTHAIAEEETFYKVLESYPEIKKDIRHSEKEHKDIFTHMKNLMSSQLIDQSYDNEVLELKKIVEHHVDEEENKIFKEAKKVLSEVEANKIKLQMHDLKEKIINGFTENMRDDLTVS
jgi:hemerythrin superfamily protein